jgi:hypothetical protein
VFVEYENSLDDVLYLNLYHYQHSPAFRMKRLAFRFALPVFSLAAWLALISMNPSAAFSGLPLLVVAVVWIGFSPRLLQRNIRRQVANLHTQGQIAGTVRRHRISLTPEAIIDKTETGKAKTMWKDVQRIVTTKRHVFIYTSAEMAHIIPKGSFSDESKCGKFVEAAKRYYEKAAT